MAWPVSARYQDFIAKTTRISAAFLNAIQDAIIGAVGGSKSLKRVTVDGVGNQSPPSSLGDLTPAMLVSEAVSANGFVLEAEYNDTLGAGHGQCRIYRTGGAGFGAAPNFFQVTNAYWVDATQLWHQEDAALPSSLVIFGRVPILSIATDLTVFTVGSGAGTWSTAGWGAGDVGANNVYASGDVSATGDVNGATVHAGTNVTATAGYLEAPDASGGVLKLGATKSSATAGAGQAVPLGTFYRDSLPLAWAHVVDSGGGVYVLSRGLNVQSMTPSGGGVFVIVLANAPTTLCVVAQITGATPGFVTTQQSGSTITVTTYNTVGVATDKAFSLGAFGG